MMMMYVSTFYFKNLPYIRNISLKGSDTLEGSSKGSDTPRRVFAGLGYP